MEYSKQSIQQFVGYLRLTNALNKLEDNIDNYNLMVEFYRKYSIQETFYIAASKFLKYITILGQLMEDERYEDCAVIRIAFINDYEMFKYIVDKVYESEELNKRFAEFEETYNDFATSIAKTIK